MAPRSPKAKDKNNKTDASPKHKMHKGSHKSEKDKNKDKHHEKSPKSKKRGRSASPKAKSCCAKEKGVPKTPTQKRRKVATPAAPMTPAPAEVIGVEDTPPGVQFPEQEYLVEPPYSDEEVPLGQLSPTASDLIFRGRWPAKV